MAEILVPTRTSEEWWAEVRSDDAQLEHWLKNQYHGEVTAAERIRKFADQFTVSGTRANRLLEIISGQESDHANWVGDLLVARGIEPAKLDKEERYWNHTLPQIASFTVGVAVAAHAEHMRLERIRVIASDGSAPADIKRVFDRILPQEVFHERAFTSLADEESMQNTKAAHELGRVTIGLFPEDF